MNDINNLDILTDKIYAEGIEKADKESKSILSKAEAERTRILDDAQSEADKILTNAKREADRVTRSAENELQLKGKQLISDLKGEIHHILSERILENNTKEAFADIPFLQSAIKEAIASWKPTSALELVLPKALEEKIEEAFYQSIRNQAKNLTITFNDKLKGGFRITEKGEGYQISFSEDDFIALFTSYLQRQTEQLLFNPSA